MDEFHITDFSSYWLTFLLTLSSSKCMGSKGGNPISGKPSGILLNRICTACVEQLMKPGSLCTHVFTKSAKKIYNFNVRIWYASISFQLFHFCIVFQICSLLQWLFKNYWWWKILDTRINLIVHIICAFKTSWRTPWNFLINIKRILIWSTERENREFFE